MDTFAEDATESVDTSYEGTNDGEFRALGLSAVNLNRFDNVTQQLLRRDLQVPLFSISGQQTNGLNGPQGNLNANSRFTLPETRFSPAYEVNNPNPQAPDSGHFIRIRPDTRFLRNSSPVETVSANQLESFNRPLSLDFAGSNRFRPDFATGAIPAQAPAVPKEFEDYVKHFQISDKNFDALKNQAEFRIPRNGLGFKVFTDGAGNIDRIETAPLPQSRLGRAAESGENYALFNTFEITHGKNFPGTAPNPIVPGADQGKGLPPTGGQPFFAQQLNQPGLRPPRPDIFQPTQIQPARVNPFDNAGLRGGQNPLLERLYQLQPAETGVNISGLDSELSAESARQVAANRAKYEVSTSEGFNRNLQGLQNAALKAGQVYSQHSFAQQMSTMIPMAPHLPQPVRPTNETGPLSALVDPGTFAAGLEDATAKRGKGGAIPFRMGGDGGGAAAGGGGPMGGFTGGFEGFGGTGGGGQMAGGQQDPRRRRFSYHA